MNKIYFLQKIYSRPGDLFVVLTPVFFIMTYCYALHMRYIKKQFLVLFTICLFILSVILYACILARFGIERNTIFEYICDALLLYCFHIGLFFVGIEYVILKLCFDSDSLYEKFKSPLLIDKTPYLYNRYRMAYIIVVLTNYSLKLSIITIFIFTWLLIILHYVGITIQPDLLIYCILFLFFVFYSCLSFLRPLVKCSNCKLDLLWPDDHGVLYCKILPRAIKEKILDCWHCGASYALDPKMNLDDVAEANKTSKVREMIFELREDKH